MTAPHVAQVALRELADRVEALDGPDREVDLAIAELAGWTLRNEPDVNGDHWIWSHPDVAKVYEDAPPFTSSLDAALPLVPEGWTIANLSQSDRKGWWCELRRGFLTSYDIVAICNQFENSNAAIAITAAALRARAHLGGSDAG